MKCLNRTSLNRYLVYAFGKHHTSPLSFFSVLGHTAVTVVPNHSSLRSSSFSEVLTASHLTWEAAVIFTCMYMCFQNPSKPKHLYHCNCHLLLICQVFAVLTLKLSMHSCHSHTCLHSRVQLLQLLLSHCVPFSHFLILFCRCRPSDAARCHHAAVAASASAITGHTHHGKHTCIYMFTN